MTKVSIVFVTLFITIYLVFNSQQSGWFSLPITETAVEGVKGDMLITNYNRNFHIFIIFDSFEVLTLLTVFFLGFSIIDHNAMLVSVIQYTDSMFCIFLNDHHYKSSYVTLQRYYVVVAYIPHTVPFIFIAHLFCNWKFVALISFTYFFLFPTLSHLETTYLFSVCITVSFYFPLTFIL